MKSYTGLVILVSAIALACGSAPANNANANRTSNLNGNVTNTSTSNMSNSMTNSAVNSTSNMSTNSTANSKANASVKSNTSTSNTSANTAVAGAKTIKGNKASKVYHLPGCPDYDKISPANVVTFNTEAEARAAGYKLAGNCK
jgi:hypothetical protein